MENNTAKISVLAVAPVGSEAPFQVTVSSEGTQFYRSIYLPANEKTDLFVPEGYYRLCVSGGAARDPGRQCKWICARADCDICYRAVFYEPSSSPATNVTLIARDANYPNITPLNGGMTLLWQHPQKP